jgi:hypothetical protein
MVALLAYTQVAGVRFPQVLQRQLYPSCERPNGGEMLRREAIYPLVFVV